MTSSATLSDSAVFNRRARRRLALLLLISVVVTFITTNTYDAGDSIKHYTVCALRLSVPHELYGLLGQAAVYAHLLGSVPALTPGSGKYTKPRSRFHSERDTTRIIVFERV